MKQPAISIVIPVYNVEKYIGECLDSIVAQTFGDWEAVCVDDGSTDSSGAILDSYAAKDPRIRVLHQPNAGAAAARNTGLGIARGIYVAFMDSDDFYPCGHVLANLYRTAQDFAAEAVAGGISYCTQAGEVKETDAFPGRKIVEYRQTQQQYGYQRYLFSRELIERGSHRFPALRWREDPPFLAKLLFSAGRYATIPEIAYCYRTRDSATRTDWLSDGGVKLRDNIKGFCEVARFAADNDLWKLFETNIYYLNDCFAFRRTAEVRLVERELRGYVKFLRGFPRATRRMLAISASGFLAEEHRIAVRAWYIAHIFGIGVLCALASAKALRKLKTLLRGAGGFFTQRRRV